MHFSRYPLKPCLFSFLILCISFTGSLAQTDSVSSPWTIHFQSTVISQRHSGFSAPYRGTNSLANNVESEATSITSTLFLGRRLWKGAAIYINPELSGGRGLSYAVGVAGALNGETYRIGNPSPVIGLERAYLQQTFSLDKAQYEDVENGINQVSERISASRITITAGKFSIADFYDRNSYSHDPRSQFMNWSLMSNGAWDYPADTRGYTSGLVVELVQPGWSLRLSSVAVPIIANHPLLEYKLGNAHSETVELEKHIRIHKRPGVVRLLYSYTASRAPSYQSGLGALTTHDTTLLKVISGNEKGTVYGGHKYGFFLNAEQEITQNIGFFARLGWNDGKYVTWAFTEIDQTVEAGLSFKGAPWKRKDDIVGLAFVVNGISGDHRDFLKAGGYGFIIGDGKLTYGNESIVEAYYNARLTTNLWVTFDYQFVSNPAYNTDRGPVHVFGIRAHMEF